ncbi:hypothetical protein ABK040_005797 [Willaertia magna]
MLRNTNSLLKQRLNAKHVSSLLFNNKTKNAFAIGGGNNFLKSEFSLYPRNYHIQLVNLSKKSSKTKLKEVKLENNNENTMEEKITVSKPSVEQMTNIINKELSIIKNHNELINSITNNFKNLDFNTCLKELEELNEKVFNEVNKDFFTKELQAIRMVYIYVDFLKLIYSDIEGKHNIPIINSLFDKDCLYQDYLKYEIASKELNNIIENKYVLGVNKDEEFISIKRKIANIKMYQNYLLNAINDLKEALNAARAIYGKASIESCYVYSELANLYNLVDNQSAAEKCAKIVLGILPQQQEKTSYMEEKIATAMMAMSDSVREERPDESIRLGTAAIKMYEKACGRRSKQWLTSVYSLISNYDSMSTGNSDADKESFRGKASTLFNLLSDMYEKYSFTNLLILPLRDNSLDEDSYDEELLLKIYKRRKYPLPFALHYLFSAARLLVNGGENEKSIEPYEKALYYLSREYPEDEYLVEKEFTASQLACVYGLINDTLKAKVLLEGTLSRIKKAIGSDNKFYEDIKQYEGLIGVSSSMEANPELNKLLQMEGADKSPEELKRELEKYGVNVMTLEKMFEEQMKSGKINSEKDIMNLMSHVMARGGGDNINGSGDNKPTKKKK